ncbi:LysM peptidoglycan-binding domain-containing protein [Tissierella sp. Yu-01]|uniref:LysM peptidoglycan-binding domain-containing protein n=1 Tax=Tissierella sp. Yu-01 TaxID=3035694 RepID=UPI00240D496E|nr:LysM peptidoglycan-binding domain-containing protein [Tissierella sp. Yu-01]WFA08124.1 LysM peptidoglycan-binding domain-containing protein [Tissierella sp. Yu-01]
MSDNNKMGRTCPTGSFAYTIRSGDTLFKLAMTYRTTVEAIMALNPGINPNNLQIGQVICIPGSSTTPPTTCPTGSFAYTIRSGDTLFLLAQRFNTTVEAIMRINPGINPNNLQIGQVICIPGSVTPPPTTCPSGSFAYTIRSGDTLYLLAIRYNTTVEAIMRINPGIDPNNLQIGQVICIPETTPPTRCPQGSFEYTIRQGDTLFSIANRYNTTVNAILALNPGLDPNNLRVGQIICVPEETPSRCPAGSFEYTIRQGDTLFSIANRYNTTVNAILALNPGLDPNNLRVGQIICIPGAMPSRCPAGSFEYTIRQGDTLFSIANRYNTTVNAILALNPGLDPNNLIVGMIICVPEESPQRCPAGSFEYTIRQGDTLFSIANRYNTTVNAILALNPGLDPNNLIVGMIICVPEESPQRCPAGSFEYTVRAGDTLFSIANRYNTTVNAILAINPGLDPNNLRVGMVICVPEESPQRCPAGSFEYTVRAGDTLFSIAQRYNTTVNAILAINPGLDPNNLRVGMIICVPRGTTPPPCDGSYYVVRSGDTLYSIANMYNITVARLMAANPGVDPNNLRVGMMLCIPRCEEPMPPCPGGTIYVVRAKDSLSSILLRFNISVMDLMEGNPDINIDKLEVGQELCILPHRDRGCPCPKGTRPYVILRADIPEDDEPVVVYLAKKFNMTVSNLLKANPNLAPEDFVEGLRICIPK